MSRIASTFSALQAQGRKALIPYVTAGFPFADITPALMHGMVEAGADVIELGVPFSDPMADGPVIQKAGELTDAPLTISAITKQLGEDPAFKKCQGDLFANIFQGVIGQHQELDALIIPELDRPLAELSPVEHAAMLIGTYELAADLSVPYKVAINEAVELTKSFGGQDGHKYVNGVLDKLATRMRATEVENKK